MEDEEMCFKRHKSILKKAISTCLWSANVFNVTQPNFRIQKKNSDFFGALTELEED